MDFDWKKIFTLGSYDVLGLDIGSSAVKMVQIHKDDGVSKVTAAAIVDIVNDPKSDQGHRKLNTVQAIQDCIGKAGVQTKFAVCGVCGPEVAVRYFKFPMLPDEEIPGAVMLEAAQVCPFNVENGGIDYQLTLDDHNSISGVLVATTDEMIKTKRTLAEEAALNNVLMDIDGLALLNCFDEYENHSKGHTTAILNVGGSFTTLAIIGDNGLPFIRDISYAGNDIIKQIAAENEITTSTAKNILLGTSNPTELELGLSGSLERASQRLITDVAETLRYYTTQEKSTAVEKVYVCGGFALVKGFVDLLNKKLSTAAVLWNPFEKDSCNVDSECEEVLAKNGPAMTVAAGLAMRTI